jgi:hypothetical protein
VVVLAYMGLFVIGSWAEARVEYKVAQLRANGQPIDLEDLKREAIPPENDAATYLRQARSDLDSIHQALESLDEDDKEPLYSRNYLTPKAKEAIYKAIADHASVFPVLERASGCADLNPDLSLNAGKDAFFESFGRNVELVRYANESLKCRALLLLADNKPDEALAVSVTMLRLARLGERVPTLIGYLVAVNCRTSAVQLSDLSLRAGPITSQTQDALDAELARVDAIGGFRWALASERATGPEWFRDFYDKLGTNRFRIPILWRTKKMNDYYAYLGQFDEPMQLIEQPYRNVSERIITLDGARLGGVMSELLRLAVKAVIQVSYQDVALVRSLRVFNALKRREQVANPDAPKLDNLGLPAEATIDPFTGEPLKILKLDSGWVVYSVGRDLKDEGGKINLFRDIGLGPEETWAPDSE